MQAAKQGTVIPLSTRQTRVILVDFFQAPANKTKIMIWPVVIAWFQGHGNIFCLLLGELSSLCLSLGFFLFCFAPHSSAQEKIVDIKEKKN